MPEYNANQAGFVRVVREYLGLTRSELAEMLDVGFESVRSWEKGRRRIPSGVIGQLQELQGQLDDEAAAVMDDYLGREYTAENPPVLRIADDPNGRPLGWQRHIAARLAQHLADLIVVEDVPSDRE